MIILILTCILLLWSTNGLLQNLDYQMRHGCSLLFVRKDEDRSQTYKISFSLTVSLQKLLWFKNKFPSMLIRNWLRYVIFSSNSFFPLSDSIGLPREKDASSFETMWTTDQVGHVPTIRTSERCLVNTAGSLELPHWVIPSRFWAAPQYKSKHYHARVFDSISLIVFHRESQ